jgi:NADPH-dependent 2,4-dienoyl-CoA reductase/sulfur reductase-like enzyme
LENVEYDVTDKPLQPKALEPLAADVVIVGGGLIGIEMTEALTKRGLQVTVLEMLPNILPGLIDEEVAVPLARVMPVHAIKRMKNKGYTATAARDLE